MAGFAPYVSVTLSSALSMVTDRYVPPGLRSSHFARIKPDFRIIRSICSASWVQKASTPASAMSAADSSPRYGSVSPA